MIKRNLSELAVYEIAESVEIVSIECLKYLYIEKTSEIVYIVKNGILYGIVCREDLFRAKNGVVPVNKYFTVLSEFNVIKAHQIFNTRKNIHKIPIVNNEGELIADYSRWDDALYAKRICKQSIQVSHIEKEFEDTVIYVVEPVISKLADYRGILECFDSSQIEYKKIRKKNIISHITENALFIFADEDEKKGSECLAKIVVNPNSIDEDIEAIVGKKFISYKDFQSKMIQETEFEKYKISNFSCKNIDDKASFLLSRLQSKGIKCFCLYIKEDRPTEYTRIFTENIWKQIREYADMKDTSVEVRNYREFYDELYQNADYRSGVAKKETVNGAVSFEVKKDVTGKYFNATAGVRKTCFQPEEYIGTIYLLGPCTIVGSLVEDQYTIASCLQKRLIKAGYAYKVENYGSLIRVDSSIDARLCEVDQFCKNDIVIYLSRVGKS